MIKNFLNPEENQKYVRGSKVMAILLKGWILHSGGASAAEGLQSMELTRLVLKYLINNQPKLIFPKKCGFLSQRAQTS